MKEKKDGLQPSAPLIETGAAPSLGWVCNSEMRGHRLSYSCNVWLRTCVTNSLTSLLVNILCICQSWLSINDNLICLSWWLVSAVMLWFSPAGWNSRWIPTWSICTHLHLAGFWLTSRMPSSVCPSFMSKWVFPVHFKKIKGLVFVLSQGSKLLFGGM